MSCRPAEVNATDPKSSGVNALPSRYMNAAICSRVTVLPGQKSVALVHPAVIARFFIQWTAGQNAAGPDPSSVTSVKPAQFCATAGAAATRNAARPAMRHHCPTRIAISLKSFRLLGGIVAACVAGRCLERDSRLDRSYANSIDDERLCSSQCRDYRGVAVAQSTVRRRQDDGRWRPWHHAHVMEY